MPQAKEKNAILWPVSVSPELIPREITWMRFTRSRTKNMRITREERDDIGDRKQKDLR